MSEFEDDDSVVRNGAELGARVSVSIRITDVEYNGKPCKMVLIRDITDLQKIEEVRNLTKMQAVMNKLITHDF